MWIFVHLFEPDGNEIQTYPIGLIALRSCYVIAN